jgi:radical SAM enzyme (TIGR01210 family)
MNEDFPFSGNSSVKALRGRKNAVRDDKPYGWLVEKERMPSGQNEEVGIVFLTNRECPFGCIYCDLWKNTTDHTVSAGAIIKQLEFALGKLQGVRHIKLYNSGSFFDRSAIPPEAYMAIASLLDQFETVIVECHPVLVGREIISFSEMLKGSLVVAMGLETVSPEILPRLNKKMSLSDFSAAAAFLHRHNINTRAFILLRPPLMTEEEGIYWAKKSIDFAFECGTECCTVIPVRGGNGAMELLSKKGLFHPPSVQSLEKVLEYGISLGKGRVFADTWDIELFYTCKTCDEKRKQRIEYMNACHLIPPAVICDHCHG